MQRSTAHVNTKPMIVVSLGEAHSELLKWYPGEAIPIGKEKVELWRYSKLDQPSSSNRNVTIGILVCPRWLTGYECGFYSTFKRSGGYVFHLTGNVQQDQQDLFSLILCYQAGLSYQSFLEMNKSDLFEFIKKIRPIENSTFLLLQCLNKKTLLGKRFWTKDWSEFRELSIDKGLLKDICDHLVKINSAYEGMIEAEFYLQSAQDCCDTADANCNNSYFEVALKYCDYATLLDPVHLKLYQQKKGEIFYLKGISSFLSNNGSTFDDYIQAINLGHKKAYEDMLEIFKKGNWHARSDSNLLESQTPKKLLKLINNLHEQYRVSLLLLFFDSNTAIYKVISKEGEPDLKKGIYKEIYDHLVKIDHHYALTINQYLKSNDNEICYYKDQAKRHIHAGEIDKAIEIYKIILEKDKNNISANRHLGIIYRDRKNYNESISYCTQALESPSFQSLPSVDQAALYRSRGDNYFNLDKWKEAILDYDESLKISETNVDTTCNSGLANCYLKLGKHSLAIDKVNIAIDCCDKTDSKNLSSLYANRGYMYHTLGDLDSAEKDLRTAISIYKEHSYLYHNIGNVFHAQGKLAEALEAYNTALSLDKESMPIYYHSRALTYQALKQYELAINDHISAVKRRRKRSKQALKMLLQIGMITEDVNADVILDAIQLFRNHEQIALIIACFGPSSAYIGKGKKLDLESVLGRKLCEVVECICRKADVNYADAMSQLVGEDYQKVKERIEDKNKQQRDADEYQKICKQGEGEDQSIKIQLTKTYLQLGMHRYALYRYHYFYVSLGNKMNDNDIISFIRNVINNNGFVENETDSNAQLLYKDDDVKMIKELIGKCSENSKSAIMDQLEKELSLLYKKLEKLEWRATCSDKKEANKPNYLFNLFFPPTKGENIDDISVRPQLRYSSSSSSSSSASSGGL